MIRVAAIVSFVWLAAMPSGVGAQAPAPVPAPMPGPSPSPWPPDVLFDFAFPPDLAEFDGQLAAQIETRAMQYAQAIDPVEIQRHVKQALQQLAAVQERVGGDPYNAGLNALQRSRYDRAVELFDQVVAAGAARADAAHYWKAFAEFRLGRVEAARQTLDALRRQFASSRYLPDARVLEAEMREQSGQPIDPALLDNDEIKLLAIQGLERNEQVVPLLEGVLGAANSLNVKRRALYVLALREDPRARELLLRYARGAGNPDLQVEGVRLLVSRRDTQTTDAVLREIYESSTEAPVRRLIIDAYRRRSIGPRGGPSLQAAAELAALYERETDLDLRRQIAGVLVSLGAADRVITVIRTERDPQMRERLVRTLGARADPGILRALTDLYGSLEDVGTREAILSALARQQNADALIRLARTETDRSLRTSIVGHLSDMAPHSPAAAAYLVEVIE